MNVLITGTDGYIGSHIAAYLRGRGMNVSRLSVRGQWPADAFQGVDAVVHAAGAAHMRESPESAALYEKINHRLTVRLAREAKSAGVKQFVFFSSMSVYGLYCGAIHPSTAPAPNTEYGLSKWNAENDLLPLEGDGFRVAILRPPMVYGKGCKGNYPRLRKLILRLPAFPLAANQRSMLHIDCLCSFAYRLLASGEGGLFFPQNRAYVSTDALAREIARLNGKSLWQFRGLGWLLKLLAPRVSTVGKVFGSLTYDQSMSAAFADEPQPDFAATMALTEERE